MNKLTISMVLFAALFAAAPAMAHDEHYENAKHPHCCPVCECRCAKLFPDTCSPFLNKFRGRRQALCEFRCTRRRGGYLPGHVAACSSAHSHSYSAAVPTSATGGSVFNVHEPANCHIVCNGQHPPGTVGNYMCNERCHRLIFTPLIPVPEGAPLGP